MIGYTIFEISTALIGNYARKRYYWSSNTVRYMNEISKLRDEDSLDISEDDLILFAYQVARGMEFISS